ncbi:MAG: hypothetical protein ACF8XB_01945 [Planctomycetota bacterium JB042]
MRISWTLVFLAASFAQASAGGFVTLKDGSIVQGQLLSCNDTQLRGLVEPDGEERVFQRDELTPASWYMVRHRTAGDDAAARLELARFCLDTGLFPHAKDEAAKAAELDESLDESAGELWREANAKAAAHLIELAENALKRRNWTSAKRLASKVLTEFTGTSAERRAEEILDELAAHEEATPTMETVVHQPLTNAQVDEMKRTDPRAVEATERLERARERNRKALKDKTLSSAKSTFEGSLKEYGRVLSIADRVLEEEKDEPLIVERVTAFKAMVSDELADVYVNLAALDASRSSYVNAMETISAGLAELPGNARLEGYREQVQMLKSLESGNRWRRRR